MAALSINRNILECKVILGKSFDCRQSRINRNILECKVVSANLPCLPLTVLIETYWNVKTCVGSHVLMLLDVLIETYWNVKRKERTSELRLFLRINRNILECKVFVSTIRTIGISCINRNILECKGLWREELRWSVYVLIETYWNVKMCTLWLVRHPGMY